MWPIDAWEPMPPRDVVTLLDGAPFRWWVSGGHALELHCGRSWRVHGDTDVGVLRSEVTMIPEWLGGWTLAVAAGGTLTRWDGRALQPGENNVWAGKVAWSVDFTVGDGSESEWIYRRNPTVRRPWAEAVLRTGEGLPYLAPDIQMLFKSKDSRPKDHEDARMVIPLLSGAERRFLLRHLPDGHAWRGLCQG